MMLSLRCQTHKKSVMNQIRTGAPVEDALNDTEHGCSIYIMRMRPDFRCDDGEAWMADYVVHSVAPNGKGSKQGKSNERVNLLQDFHNILSVYCGNHDTKYSARACARGQKPRKTALSESDNRPL